MHREIAGAGLAGLASAIAPLARLGMCVHEKAATLRAFAAGISVWEDGLPCSTPSVPATTSRARD